jgi:hypothetical protein
MVMAPINLSEIHRVRRAMRNLGAVDPGSARQASELPEAVRSELGRFVDSRIIREGPAGTYYLHEATASAVFRVQVLKVVVFWFLVIMIPVALLQLSNVRPAP